jgi:hypothetical protein
MSSVVWEKLGNNLQVERALKMEAANSTITETHGRLRNVRFTFDDIDIYLQVQVMSNAPYDILLGRLFYALTGLPLHPLIVTLVIALPLDQVLQMVVAHSAVQYSLNLIIFLTIDKSWGWGWCRSLARDVIGMRNGQLDHGEDRVEVVEVGGKSEAVCTMATQASMTKGPKRQ